MFLAFRSTRLSSARGAKLSSTQNNLSSLLSNVSSSTLRPATNLFATSSPIRSVALFATKKVAKKTSKTSMAKKSTRKKTSTVSMKRASPRKPSQRKTITVKKRVVKRGSAAKRKVEMEKEKRAAQRERKQEMLERRREKRLALLQARRERRETLNERRKERNAALREEMRERNKLKRARNILRQRLAIAKERRMVARKLRSTMPKKAPGPFGVFVKEKFAALKQKDPFKTVPMIMKELSQQWATVSSEEKQKCVDISHSMREKYLKAKAQHNAQFPKRLTSFNFFMKDNYQVVKKQKPEAPMSEVSSTVSQMWKNASQDVKNKYAKMSSALSEKRKVSLEKLARAN